MFHARKISTNKVTHNAVNLKQTCISEIFSKKANELPVSFSSFQISMV